MVFDRKTLVIPDKTKFDERIINVNGDVVIGDRSMLQLGVKTDGRIFVGEHVIVDGNLAAKNDVRIDIFSNIGGDIASDGNAYIGEKVKIKGKLSLKGDLDVGDSVEIEHGFEAKGWINIRSPIPTIIYIFIYLLQLLKMGHSEEIERILEELEDNEGETIPISESFLFIPNNAIIGVQKSRVDYNLRVGKKCRIIGNYDVKGDVYVDMDSSVIGSVHATGDVFCGGKVNIQGNIVSGGIVTINEDTQIVGDVSGDVIHLSKTATVGGKLLAKNGILFIDTSEEEMTEKVKRFESDADVVDEVKIMLE
jgi:predicted acyltransferase (DUF342 family)